jgi:hypothetical protein
MSLFIKDSTVKSTVFLNAFALSMAYAAVYVFAYILTAGLVAHLVPEASSSWLPKLLPPSLICIAASLVCTVPIFFMENKKTVLIAFGLLGGYAAAIAIGIVLGYSAEQRYIFWQLFLFYIFFPAFWGNLVIWSIVWILF